MQNSGDLSVVGFRREWYQEGAANFFVRRMQMKQPFEGGDAEGRNNPAVLVVLN